MRLIDADALKRQIRQGIDPHNFSAVMAAGAFFGEVDKSPTVDAVLVIRCKDCEFWNYADCVVEGNCYCDMLERYTLENFYCAAGIRRDEDEQKKAC